jgi:hypothetical protein
MDIGRTTDKLGSDDKLLTLKIRNLLLKASVDQDDRTRLRPKSTASGEPSLPFLCQG